MKSYGLHGEKDLPVEEKVLFVIISTELVYATRHRPAVRGLRDISLAGLVSSTARAGRQSGRSFRGGNAGGCGTDYVFKR